ncbi:MAG: hypothetical protein ACKN9A_21080 [Microcystis aeruginosa]
MNQISSYINQANEELEAATLLLEKNYYRACISRCYGGGDSCPIN